MIEQTIICERKTCHKQFTEAFENQGFPGWGHVAGLANEKGVPVTLHLCPECMQEIIEFMKGGKVNGLG